jgi:hypothetical protein
MNHVEHMENEDGQGLKYTVYICHQTSVYGFGKWVSERLRLSIIKSYVETYFNSVCLSPEFMLLIPG